MKENVCRYNKYGYCQYGDKCHFMHVNNLCEKNECTVFECDMRHPVVCKFYRNFRRYKFSNCAYKHEKEVHIVDEKIEAIEKRIEKMEKEPKKKDIHAHL